MHHYMKKCITCKLHEVYIYYMAITCFCILLQKLMYHHLQITCTLHLLHIFYSTYMYYIHFTSVSYFSHLQLKNDLLYNLVAANLFNVHEDVRSRPSTWFVVCFLPSLGPESKWDERGGNSKSVRNTELMMEYNDCLLRKLAQQIECEKEKHFKIKLYNVL